MDGLDDIEDILGPPEERPPKKYIVPRNRRKKTDNSNDVDSSPCQADSFIPGTQTIYVKTWGCSHNSSDSEYMAGQLAANGYKITENKDEADLWLLNSCTVKTPAEDHFRNEINKGRELNKKVVVSGCIPQGAPKSEYIQGLSVIGVQQIDRVVEVVEEALKGNSVRLLGTKKQDGKKKGGASLSLPKIRRNPLIEIIAINTGCLNQCTYCKTKHARGELGSYEPEEIVARAKQSFEEGCVEIWLTSEDLGAYGHDIGVTLPQLLWQLVEVIPEGARLRCGMTNPPYILEHLQEMSEVLQHPRVYAFLHVPVQAASDNVLADMAREYTQEDFRHVVDFLKERVPEVNIATDIIAGFPTETSEDFDETLTLVKDYKFASLFINQFYGRPGTPAARMEQVPALEKKRRTKALTDLFHSYEPYGHKVGRIEHVLVTELSHDKQYYVGHDKSYQQVLVPKNTELMGKLVEVEIVSAGKHYMKARLVTDESEARRPENVPPPLAQGDVSGLATEKVSSISSDSAPPPLWVRVVAGSTLVLLFARFTYSLLYKARGPIS